MSVDLGDGGRGRGSGLNLAEQLADVVASWGRRVHRDRFDEARPRARVPPSELADREPGHLGDPATRRLCAREVANLDELCVLRVEALHDARDDLVRLLA